MEAVNIESSWWSMQNYKHVGPRSDRQIIVPRSSLHGRADLTSMGGNRSRRVVTVNELGGWISGRWMDGYRDGCIVQYLSRADCNRINSQLNRDRG